MCQLLCSECYSLMHQMFLLPMLWFLTRRTRKCNVPKKVKTLFLWHIFNPIFITTTISPPPAWLRGHYPCCGDLLAAGHLLIGQSGFWHLLSGLHQAGVPGEFEPRAAAELRGSGPGDLHQVPAQGQPQVWAGQHLWGVRPLSYVEKTWADMWWSMKSLFISHKLYIWLTCCILCLKNLSLLSYKMGHHKCGTIYGAWAYLK